jgi:lysophospholipid acyltransferase (LPLAT)-like uncharacterized protein
LKTLLMYLAYGLIRLLNSTYRYTYHGLENLEHARRLGRGRYVFAIFHQNLFAGILAQARSPHTVIVSRSSDGDPAAFLCSRFGFVVARGSSKKGTRDKGGREAKEEMIESLVSGGPPGALTVDGPRGPAHEVKPGIIEIARRAKVPIVAYLAIPDRCWTFNSWDRFRLPKPFAKIDVYYGPPYEIPEATAFEDFAGHQAKIAQQLLAMEEGKLVSSRAQRGTP